MHSQCQENHLIAKLFKVMSLFSQPSSIGMSSNQTTVSVFSFSDTASFYHEWKITRQNCVSDLLSSYKYNYVFEQFVNSAEKIKCQNCLVAETDRTVNPK